ncbi:GNAT family N-acetyltransferase [Salicibibacter cibarius]|uniref:GNAT family N-acetyltransferase n=1 Tax=Salicibibacter cibarius TaxID=2743000 RepID=A0A7T6Z2M6_9BACI|nr:GNAT family N-acetyltransferase [Salicibibacter cibarius]QQK75552.1 GNAT family N-acetyltransferase [Salicibibacter cibarius]
MFNSDRLYFREIAEEDRKPLEDLFADPAVMRFADGTKTKRGTGEWMEQSYRDYRSFGVGYWVAEKRGNGEFVGQCGFRPQKIQGQIHMGFGYLLARNAWGEGYGKEAAYACSNFAFEQLAIDELTSIIHPQNIPSIKIARFLGMEKQDRIRKHCQWMDVYRLENPGL